MMLSPFETTTFGKWILVGEHAVLRGHGALVFPVKDKQLTLTFIPEAANLSADYAGVSGQDLHLLFWSVLEHGMHLLGKSINTLSGHFVLESNIPIGVGMGASAALCVATARWFLAQNMIEDADFFHFARQLEDLFHGKSSGLDIAGVAATEGIYFQQGQYRILEQAWRPYWALSSTGQIGMTSHCIHQVDSIWDRDPTLGRSIDRQMAQSVQQAEEALALCDTNSAIQRLAVAINLANDCFHQWGLLSENLQQHMTTLKEAGALAAKPTGSGGGGFVVSLWDNPLPAGLDLIEV